MYMSIVSFIKHQLSHESFTRRTLQSVQMVVNQEAISRKVDYYTDKAIHCIESGVSDTLFHGEEIVVSLTTFGRRIEDVYLPIESIMQGTVKPNRIVLWLSKDEFSDNDIPRLLRNQQKRGLQIEYYEDLRSYTKIYPTLIQYPESVVVTIDDDAIYDFELLERLLNTHITNVGDICACRIHRMTLNAKGELNSYLKWDWEVSDRKMSNLNFLTGVGGVLYPPHCFCPQFYQKDKFLSLCPYADDVWINAMIWLSGKQISKVITRAKDGCDYFDISRGYLSTLSAVNNNPKSCKNDSQIKAVFDEYKLYRFLKG